MIGGVMFLALVALIGAIVFRFLERRDGDPRRLHHLEERVARLETTMEGISSEMERLSEGQRFMTKLLADRSSASARVDDPESRA